MSFDRLRTNGKGMIPFVVNLSNHERNRLLQRVPKRDHEATFEHNACLYPFWRFGLAYYYPSERRIRIEAAPVFRFSLRPSG